MAADLRQQREAQRGSLEEAVEAAYEEAAEAAYEEAAMHPTRRQRVGN